MTLEGARRQLLEEIKYQKGFPPRARATVIKNDLASRGLSSSGALAEQVAGVYCRAVETILDDFADAVLSKRSALAISGESELRAVISDAHQQMFAEARGCLLDDLGGVCDARGPRIDQVSPGCSRRAEKGQKGRTRQSLRLG